MLHFDKMLFSFFPLLLCFPCTLVFPQRKFPHDHSFLHNIYPCRNIYSPFCNMYLRPRIRITTGFASTFFLMTFIDRPSCFSDSLCPSVGPSLEICLKSVSGRFKPTTPALVQSFQVKRLGLKWPVIIILEFSQPSSPKFFSIIFVYCICPQHSYKHSFL